MAALRILGEQPPRDSRASGTSGRRRRTGSGARRGPTTTVDGTPAIKISARSGKSKGTIYVSTEGEPYLLEIINEGAARPESVAFSEYDKPVKTTPPIGDVVDLEKLEKLAG